MKLSHKTTAVAVSSFLLVLTRNAGSAADAKYSIMSTEDAGKLVETALHEVPRPGATGSWELPKPSPQAAAVRITDTDFVLYAPVAGNAVEVVEADNLEEFFPAVDRELVSSTFVGGDPVTGDASKRFVFLLETGILFTSVDLESPDPVLEKSGGSWKKAKLLPKGGYIWQLSRVGVQLRGRWTTRLLAFNTPMTEEFIRIRDERPVLLGNFETANDTITLTVANRSFKLKPAPRANPSPE